MHPTQIDDIFFRKLTGYIILISLNIYNININIR